jgi:hypothetical protein
MSSVTWFYPMMTQVPQSHQECKAVSDACLHLSQLGMFTSPSLNMCPVSNPVIILSWFIIRLSNSPHFFSDGFLNKTHTLPLQIN